MDFSLSLLGIDVRSAANQADDERSSNARLAAMQCDGDAGWNWSRALPAARPVLGSAGGAQYYSLTTPKGPVLLPYVAGTPFDATDPTLATGGFVSTSQLNGLAGQGHAPDATALAGQLAAYSAAGANQTTPSSTNSAEPAPRPESGLHNPLSPFSQNLLSNLAAYQLSGDGISAAFRNGLLGAGSAVANQLVSNLTGKLFDMWQLDDSSSTGEYVGKQAAQLVASKIQAELMSQLSSKLFNSTPPDGVGKRLAEFFGGQMGTATLGAAHVGTKDDKANTAIVVPAGPPVHVNDLPAAKAFVDSVVPAGKLILDGSMTVLVNEKMFARMDSKTAVPSGLKAVVSANVLVGGASPVPAATSAAENVLNSANGTLEQAEAASTRIAGPAEAARQAALAEGMSEAEAEAIANAKGEMIANERPITKENALGMVNFTYQDGKPGMSSDNSTNITTYDGKESELNTYTDEVTGDKWHVMEIRDPDHPGASNANLPIGYRAVVFQNPATGQAVAVFQGSNNPTTLFSDPSNTIGDWLISNIGQGVGFVPPQYRQAASDLSDFSQRYPGLTNVAGHSLGGGLATYAGLVNGMPVTAYNAAGLGSGSMLSVSHSGTPSWPGQIQNHNIQGELVTGQLVMGGQPSVFGDVHEYPFQTQIPKPGGGTTNANSIDNHSSQTIGQAMQQGQVGPTQPVHSPNPPVLFPNF